MNPTITVWSQPRCGPCVSTKHHLRKLGLEFVEKQISDAAPTQIEQWRTAGYLAAPVVEATVNNITYVWAGHRPDDIKALNFLVKEAAA